MRRHLRDEDLLRGLGKARRLSWNDDPEYLRKLKERLAVAALDLKLNVHNQLDDIGVLYDKMIYTGTVEISKTRPVWGSFSRPFARSHSTRDSQDTESGSRLAIGRGQVTIRQWRRY